MIFNNVDPDIINIISSISKAGINIYNIIKEGTDNEQSTLQKNISGDTVHNLDLLSSSEFINALSIPSIHSIVGEESEKPITINTLGKYRVAFDPLDGSSNIGLNSTIGSIFTVFKNNSPSGFMRKGCEQVLSGYLLYGPALEMVVSYDGKTKIFYHDTHKQILIEKQDNILCPSFGKYYSVNYCNKEKWKNNIAQANYCFIIDGKHTFRYSGSLVADFHRILLKGGMFAYHGDKDNPEGKLRLLYECFPMAKIIESAGGCAINDYGERILDLTLTTIHEKSSIIIGSKDTVSDFIKYAKPKF